MGMLDVHLPRLVIWLELIALIVAAMGAEGRVGGWARVIAGVAAAATAGGIALSTYIGWNRPCAAVIDGLQGRYFLPILPLLMVVLALPLIRRREALAWGALAVGAGANVAGLVAVALRYY